MQQEHMTLSPGVTLRDTHGASYIVEGLLGKGGFGAVYVVRDRRIKSNLFALKELNGQDKLDRDCFLFEGELLKRLDNRALPHVYSVFEHKKLQRVYMLMDYIRGRNLEHLRKEQPEQRFEFHLVLAMLAPIVNALIYLHHQDPPIVHRDIKPGNIIKPSEGNETILVDFGTAKEYDSEATTSVIRHVSSGYAAPEQYMGGTNPRTDIYGLGATLYTLLTGQIPPDALVRATKKQGFDPLQPANLVTPSVPATAARIIQRAMSLSSDDRFETVEEFWRQVLAHEAQQQEQASQISSGDASQPLPAQNQAITAPAVVQERRSSPRLNKRLAFLPVLLALLLTLAMGTAFLLYTRSYNPALSATQSNISLPNSKVKSSSTPVSRASLYPPLAASYAGTIVDLMTKQKTVLFLTNIEQSQGIIRGYFQGLGQVGLFKGSVSRSGQVQFTLTIYQGNAALTFEGDIKIGGDIVGSFDVLDRHGQRTGEFGLWNTSPHP